MRNNCIEFGFLHLGVPQGSARAAWSGPGQSCDVVGAVLARGVDTYSLSSCICCIRTVAA